MGLYQAGNSNQQKWQTEAAALANGFFSERSIYKYLHLQTVHATSE